MICELFMPAPLPALVREALSARCAVVEGWRFPQRGAALAAAAGARIVVAGVPILAEGVVWLIDAAVMAALPELALIANLGVGYDNIDVATAAARGIVVTNTPDVLTEETADTAMGLVLCAVRRLPQADRYLREGRWRDAPFPLTASLRGRTMGVVGLGRIGRAIARRAEAFGLGIVYHGRRRQADVAYPYFTSLLDMARACDILMVSVPGGGETRHLVDAAVLDALGRDGVLVNIARGGIVDEAALTAALRDGRILAAGLDVFAHEPEVPAELIALDNVVLLPHVGSASGPTRDAMSQLLVDNVLAFLRGEAPPTPVAETPIPEKSWPARAKGPN